MIAINVEQSWDHSFRILIQKLKLVLALNANLKDHLLSILSR